MQSTERVCRVVGCNQGALPALASEQFCLSHFLELTKIRAGRALAMCHEARELEAGTIDWLLSDAQRILHSLAEDAGRWTPQQQERILELFLCLANLWEYVNHHSVQLAAND